MRVPLKVRLAVRRLLSRAFGSGGGHGKKQTVSVKFRKTLTAKERHLDQILIKRS